MSRELAYVLLICGLMLIPGLLQRFRVPPPLTCFLLGLAVILAVPGIHHGDAVVHLLAALGICSASWGCATPAAACAWPRRSRPR